MGQPTVLFLRYHQVEQGGFATPAAVPVQLLEQTQALLSRPNLSWAEVMMISHLLVQGQWRGAALSKLLFNSKR